MAHEIVLSFDCDTQEHLFLEELNKKGGRDFHYPGHTIKYSDEWMGLMYSLYKPSGNGRRLTDSNGIQVWRENNTLFIQHPAVS